MAKVAAGFEQFFHTRYFCHLKTFNSFLSSTREPNFWLGGMYVCECVYLLGNYSISRLWVASSSEKVSQATHGFWLTFYSRFIHLDRFTQTGSLSSSVWKAQSSPQRKSSLMSLPISTKRLPVSVSGSAWNSKCITARIRASKARKAVNTPFSSWGICGSYLTTLIMDCKKQEGISTIDDRWQLSDDRLTSYFCKLWSVILNL